MRMVMMEEYRSKKFPSPPNVTCEIGSFPSAAASREPDEEAGLRRLQRGPITFVRVPDEPKQTTIEILGDIMKGPI